MAGGSRPKFGVFVVTLGVSWGCAPTSTEPTPPLARTSSQVSVQNGFQINGITANGAWMNGLPLNGLFANGLPLNGLPLNGLFINGLSANGIGENGLPLNGLPLNGLYVNGLPLNGLPLNGLPLNGLPLNGLYANGLPLNGLFVNGLPLNGIALNGLPLNGLFVNGLPLNGIALNGLPLNGLFVNGLPLNGVPLDGLFVNGGSPATAIQVADNLGNLVDLSAVQEAELQRVMSVLVACALPTGDALTIYGSDGAPVRYSGLHGLAPEWKSAASGLGPRDPDGVDAEEKIRWCAEHYRALDANNAVYPGLALNAQQVEGLKVLFQYAVECALNPDQTVTMTFPLASGSEDVTFSGALGLAPEWATGGLDTQGQKIVSACLGARTNALGLHVRISLRGPATFSQLQTTPLERRQLPRHEGAFWGNLFGDQPYLYACQAEGGGPAGRLCTNGDCGFKTTDPETAGLLSCGRCGARDADGNWTDCPEYDESGAVCTRESRVLNTFLMLESPIASGTYTSCVRHPDDRLECWGTNSGGQFGNGTTTDSDTPVPAALGMPGTPGQVQQGYHTACSRQADGTLWCWGDNTYGQLGDGTTTDRLTPIQVTAMANQTAKVFTYRNHNCALKMDGTLWCWGLNNYGQLGDGSTTNSLTPIQVTALGNQVVSADMGDYHTCALKMDGTLWCWGKNSTKGTLGVGSTATQITTPTQVSTLGNHVVELSIHNSHAWSCALKDDRTVWCWGDNTGGNLGDGTTTHRTTPVQVLALGDTVVDLCTSHRTGCAIKADGTVWCWGENYEGELGVGTFDGHPTPVQVLNLPRPAKKLSCPRSATFAFLDDGSIWSWGHNKSKKLGRRGISANTPIPGRMDFFVQPGDGVCDVGESSVLEPLDCALAQNPPPPPTSCLETGASCTSNAECCGSVCFTKCGTQGVFDARIDASNNDSEELVSSGAIDLTSSDLELVKDGAEQLVGMRFTNVAIPAGAVITKAYVQFTVDETGADASNLTIRGQAEDSPLPFTTSARDISSRPVTAASVAWSPPPWDSVGGDQATPDLSAVVQEIVDRRGWQANNGMVILISGSGRRTAESYDGAPSLAPLLHVLWSSGGCAQTCQ